MYENAPPAHWDERYRARAAGSAVAMPVLIEKAHLLPVDGVALDLACGLGGNALMLARRRFRVYAWDASAEAIARLAAAAEGLPVVTEVRDVLVRPPLPDGFDVICVGNFLERGLCAALAAALRPGGLLYYETWTAEGDAEHGPRNPAFRLAVNELLQLFAGLTVRFYREDGPVGDPALGLRQRAQLVAQRRD